MDVQKVTMQMSESIMGYPVNGDLYALAINNKDYINFLQEKDQVQVQEI